MYRLSLTLLGSALCAFNLSAQAITLVQYDFDAGSASSSLNGAAVNVHSAITDAGGASSWVANSRFNADGSFDSGGTSKFSAYIHLGSYINDLKGDESAYFELTGTIEAPASLSAFAFNQLAAPDTTLKTTDPSGSWGSVERNNSNPNGISSRLSTWAGGVPLGTMTTTVPLTIRIDLRTSSGYNGSNNYGTMSWLVDDSVERTVTMSSNVAFTSLFISSAEVSTASSRTDPLFTGNFTLTQIPEPSSAALLGGMVVLTAVAVRRRRRN